MENGSFNVDEWCKYQRLSRAKLYQLWAEGKGPRRMEVGNRVFITRKADDEWRQRCEAETSAKHREAA